MRTSVSVVGRALGSSSSVSSSWTALTKASCLGLSKVVVIRQPPALRVGASMVPVEIR